MVNKRKWVNRRLVTSLGKVQRGRLTIIGIYAPKEAIEEEAESFLMDRIRA
jgi:hypothetical protein